MKATLIKFAAAAIVSGAIAGGAASANAAMPNVTGPVSTPATKDGAVQPVYYPRYGARSCRRLYRLAFYHGSPWAKRQYYRFCRYGRPGARPYQCRRWYVMGYRYGNPRARHMFNRFCRYGIYRRAGIIGHTGPR